jgi:hypothetical protein
MKQNPNSYPDLDALVTAIKAEAARRSPFSAEFEPDKAATTLNHSALNVAAGVVQKEPFYTLDVASHVRDFVPLFGPDFVSAVFRTFLRREPDAQAMAFYLKEMAQGRRTRWEVLLSVFISPEARRIRRHFPGVWSTAFTAALYRIPLLGWPAGIIAKLLNLPPYLCNLPDLDRTTLATINALR